MNVNPRQSTLAAQRASACATVVLAEKRSAPAGIAIAGSETNLVAPPPGPTPAEIACRPPYARTYLGIWIGCAAGMQALDQHPTHKKA